jgi:hypothetical protein
LNEENDEKDEINKNESENTKEITDNEDIGNELEEKIDDENEDNDE